MKTRILVTGGAGFIGHHCIEHLLKNTDWDIIIIDSLSYASNGMDRLHDIKAFDEKRCKLLTFDLSHKLPWGVQKEIGQVDYIVHMAAETHVDNSIADPEVFVQANVVGTFHMLQFARSQGSLKRFVYFSTDEVFGPAPPGVAFKEWDRYNSGNPYSATKAGGEELCLAWHNTYKVPVMITHTMNAFGERQHPEKFIPLVVRKVLAGEVIQIHSNPGRTASGSRFYIHCRNIAAAMLFLLEKGEVGEKYNVVGEREISNLDLAQFIAKVIGRELNYQMVDFHSSRPGHDLRYCLDGTRMKDMGWTIPATFEASLEKTVRWMLQPENLKWLFLSKEAYV
jgi:dTDP-glucose 4,6-dehydratase